MRTKTKSKALPLTRRIRKFYALLNEKNYTACHEMIDPRIRAKPASVTLLQYQNAMRDFLQAVDHVKVKAVDVTVHRDEASVLYEDRDFALGQTIWEDGHGEKHVFSERWVREGRSWYTRSTGLIAPVRQG